MKNITKEEIQEIVYMAVQSTKKENSGLMSDIRKSITILETHYDGIKSDLVEIKEQTKKTNGRVNALEIDSATNKGWIRGVGIVGGIIATLIAVIFSLTVTGLKEDIAQNTKQIDKLLK